MPKPCTLLVLEDEPLIMMDLQFSGEDHDCTMLCAASCSEAMRLIDDADDIDAAILDVSLGEGSTCLPVARKLEGLSIPYILHSGDLDRHNETIRTLKAKLVPKPVSAEKVIAEAIACAENDDD